MQSVAELVSAARNGDKSAFLELVRLFERSAIITSYSVVRDYHAAEDVAQESFVLAFSRLQQLRDASSFGPWLLQIVRRNAMAIRREQSSKVLCEDIEVSSNDPALQWIEQHDELISLLAQLADADRALVTLRYVDGRSVDEIATAIGKPAETVRKQLYRILQKLRKSLREIEL